MSEAVEIGQDEVTDIVEYAAADPVSVLTDEQKYSAFLNFVKAEIAKHTPLVETAEGRQEIKSLAYKVTRTKTTIDNAGKEITEEARKHIDAVNAKRRKVREELDTLAKQVRQPLTEWEEAEKAREQHISDTFEHLANLASVPAEMSSDTIAGRIEAVDEIEIPEAVFRNRTQEAELLRDKTRNDLQALFERTKQHEADQAELARLRAEREERERQERERQEAEEAARAERERQEREAAEAKEREERAAAEAQRREEEAAERARAEERERAEQAERERQEAEEARRREEERRAADQKHRAAVKGEAQQALVALGVDESLAKTVVQAIADGEIPHVSMRF